MACAREIAKFISRLDHGLRTAGDLAEVSFALRCRRRCADQTETCEALRTKRREVKVLHVGVSPALKDVQ
jgi:hypothetical protein